MADRPQRIQLSRAKGWRLPPGAMSVARPTRWGNPWTVAGARKAGFSGTDTELRATCVAMFRNGLKAGVPALNGMWARIPELRGKSLACWCPLPAPGEPDHCHAAVLLKLANAPLRCEPA
jgi:hypothetical protein